MPRDDRHLPGRAFALDAPHRLSSAPADTWDQIAKFGRFVKDDGDGPQEAVFNLEHLGQFLDNFAAQVNPLWADFNHDFGDALARYDALTLVVDGVPVRTVTRAAVQSAVGTPEAAKLVNPDSGVVEDGIYAHRYEVTPLGQEKLPNVSYVSPLFLTNGKDEQGNDIGYVLLNIAWTNGPFLDGMMPLRMMRLPSRFSKGAPMNEWMKRYGVDDSASPDQMKAAMKKYAEEVDGEKKRTDEAMARFRRFADAIGDDEQMTKFLDSLSDEKAMARFRQFMGGGGGDDDGDEDDKKQMTAMAKLLDVEPTMSAIAAKVTELRFTSAPKSEIATLKRKLADLEEKETRRAADEKKSAVMAFARRWTNKESKDCAWDPDDVDSLAEFYRRAPELATAHVEKHKGEYSPERLTALRRFTRNGAPIDKPEGEPLNLAGDDPDEVARRFDQAAKQIETEEKVTYAVAMTRVKTKQPELYAAYVASRG